MKEANFGIIIAAVTAEGDEREVNVEAMSASLEATDTPQFHFIFFISLYGTGSSFQ